MTNKRYGRVWRFSDHWRGYLRQQRQLRGLGDRLGEFFHPFSRSARHPCSLPIQATLIGRGGKRGRAGETAARRWVRRRHCDRPDGSHRGSNSNSQGMFRGARDSPRTGRRSRDLLTHSERPGRHSGCAPPSATRHAGAAEPNETPRAMRPAPSRGCSARPNSFAKANRISCT